MAELIAKSPCAGLVPVKTGKLALVEADLGVMTSCMAYAGQGKAFGDALKAAHGIAAPAVGRATGKAGARAIWFGRDQVMLCGPAADDGLAQFAALSDQSDAWACVELSGPGAVDVLARLVPLDLRAGVFKRGHAARSLIGHMSGAVVCLGADRFLLMVFRSMAATLVHEVTVAMEIVTARG